MTFCDVCSETIPANQFKFFAVTQEGRPQVIHTLCGNDRSAGGYLRALPASPTTGRPWKPTWYAKASPAPTPISPAKSWNGRLPAWPAG